MLSRGVKTGIVLLAVLMLSGCGENTEDMAASIPDYTMVPTTAPTEKPTAEPTEEPEEAAPTDKPKEEVKVKSIDTKTVRKYQEEEINIDELEGVDNFKLTEDNVVWCHDNNESGSNTFSIYTMKKDGTWKKTENKVISSFVNKYRVQVTKMRDYLTTIYDETIIMGDDYVLYKLDDKGNEIVSAKMSKLFGEGTYVIEDWHWYKGNKVIMKVSRYDINGRLKKRQSCMVDIDSEKIVKKYSQDWEMRLYADGKIYGEQVDHNSVITIMVINPETGKVEQKISASDIRKTALDRTDWDEENDDYSRNGQLAYAVCDGKLYVKYLTGVYRFDEKKEKWQQLLKESKNFTMGNCSPVVFKVVDENHFYMMGTKGFYLYSAKESKKK